MDSTQPLTQPFQDPRRHGHPSMVSERDESDILCILVPASASALSAVDRIRQTSPQHVLQNETLEAVEDHGLSLVYDEAPSHGTNTPSYDLPHTSSAHDIALRMSSALLQPQLGFVFGRNPKLCDLVLSDSSLLKVSNKHFRIFVNVNGILMLEDTSTNGTYVDNVLLRCRNQDGASSTTRTLNSGSMIALPTVSRAASEVMRFLVKFPPRIYARDRYDQNLAAYLIYVEQCTRKLQLALDQNAALPVVVGRQANMRLLLMQAPLQCDESPALCPRLELDRRCYERIQPRRPVERRRQVQHCEPDRQRRFCYCVQALFSRHRRSLCLQADREASLHQRRHSQSQSP